MLLKSGETLENYIQIYDEYKIAHQAKKEVLNNLNNEIKIIKKLKV